MIAADFILAHAGELVTMAGSPFLPRRGPDSRCISLVRDGALAARGGVVVWTGVTDRLTREISPLPGAVEYDAAGRVVTPGFVDSHTHPLYAGGRQAEFAMRAEGADYEEIARAGGGILNSVDRTRSAPDSEIAANLARHLGTMLFLGTTTVEAKSGYGLDLHTEIRCLDILRSFSESWPQTVVATFLGAHEIPRDFAGRGDDYLAYLVSEVLPLVRQGNLASYVDIFCELGVFSAEQSRSYLTAAAAMGFGIRMHADEFHDTGGAAVAVETGAASADHLLSISDGNIRRISASTTVATLLPGTAFFLGKPWPPARKLLDSGAAVAIATDFNPGSCFCESMPFMINLAVCQCGFTIEEALTAATANGASALGLSGRKGCLQAGADADMVIWDLDDHRGIAYHIAVPDIEEVLISGRSAVLETETDRPGREDLTQSRGVQRC
jgi:imidazolonepropionase